MTIIHPSYPVCLGFLHLLQEEFNYSRVHIYQELEEFFMDAASKFPEGVVFVDQDWFMELKEEFVRLLPPDHYILIVSRKDDLISREFKCIPIDEPRESFLEKISGFIHEKDVQVSAKQHELSDREKEVLVCVAQGKINKEIADFLNISIHTVITHRKNISGKLGIKSIAGLTAYALLNDLLDFKDLS